MWTRAHDEASRSHLRFETSQLWVQSVCGTPSSQSWGPGHMRVSQCMVSPRPGRSAQSVGLRPPVAGGECGSSGFEALLVHSLAPQAIDWLGWKYTPPPGTEDSQRTPASRKLNRPDGAAELAALAPHTQNWEGLFLRLLHSLLQPQTAGYGLRGLSLRGLKALLALEGLQGSWKPCRAGGSCALQGMTFFLQSIPTNNFGEAEVEVLLGEAMAAFA